MIPRFQNMFYLNPTITFVLMSEKIALLCLGQQVAPSTGGPNKKMSYNKNVQAGTFV